jgi:hypothetical protein
MKLPWAAKPAPTGMHETFFISLGLDCNPAIELRSLGLRKTAMPFDWLRSTPAAIEHCIRTDFSGFHADVRLDPVAERVVDSLAMEFSHDYPTLENYNNDARTVEGWEAYIPLITEKYRPRIERFIGLLRSSDIPVVILCTMNFADIEKVREAIRETYGRTSRLVFVSLTAEVFPSNHNTLWCGGASKDILPQRLQFAAQLASTTS